MTDWKKAKLADPYTLRWLADEYEKSATWLVDQRGSETQCDLVMRARDEAMKLRAMARRAEQPSELDQPNIIESLADYAHEAWSGWMRYLFEKSSEVEGHIIIHPYEVSRWKRQAATPYSELPEEEKESDRIEARKILATIKGEK